MLSHRQGNVLKATSGATTEPQFAASYVVYVFSVGAVASAASMDTTPDVHAGHSFAENDKALIWDGSATTLTDAVTSATNATQLTFTASTPSISKGDLLVNLGPDGGSTTPSLDAGKITIYSDPQGTNAITGNKVTSDSTGNYDYYHRGDGRFWEVITDASGTVVQVIDGFAGVGSRLNIVDFGADPSAADNSDAIQACFNVAKALDIAVYIPAGEFTITDTIWAGKSGQDGADGDVQKMYGEGYQSVIKGEISNGIVLDLAGAHITEYSSFRIASDTGTVPSVGIYMARTTASNRAANVKTFYKVFVDGHFQTAALVNQGTEENHFIHCKFGISGGGGRAAVLSHGKDRESLASQSKASDVITTDQSHNHCVWQHCFLENITGTTNATDCVVEIDSFTHFIFKNNYVNTFNTPGASATDIVNFRVQSTDKPIRGLLMDGTIWHGLGGAAFVPDLVEFDRNGSSNNFFDVTIRSSHFSREDGTERVFSTGTVQMRRAYIEAPTIDFSSSTADFIESSFLKCMDDAGTISLANRFEGRIEIPAAATLTITTPTQVFGEVLFTDTGDLKHYGSTSYFGNTVERTIASGAITVTQGIQNVDTESDAASDDLDTINGGIEGQMLILTANASARTVVVKHNTGNIQCGADFSLDNANDTITLMYDGSNWLMISSASNGT